MLPENILLQILFWAGCALFILGGVMEMIRHRHYYKVGQEMAAVQEQDERNGKFRKATRMMILYRAWHWNDQIHPSIIALASLLAMLIPLAVRFHERGLFSRIINGPAP